MRTAAALCWQVTYKPPSTGSNESVQGTHIASGDEVCICDALVALAFYEANWRLAQDKRSELLSHGSPDVSGLAATCLGHIARIRHKLDKDKGLRALRGCLDDDAISGRVADALDDIELFLE